MTLFSKFYYMLVKIYYTCISNAFEILNFLWLSAECVLHILQSQGRNNDYSILFNSALKSENRYRFKQLNILEF